MSLFEVVVIVVAIICIPLAAVMHFPVRKLIDQVGRRGALWFDHSEDVPVRDQPSEDARDAPIPFLPGVATPSAARSSSASVKTKLARAHRRRSRDSSRHQSSADRSRSHCSADWPRN